MKKVVFKGSGVAIVTPMNNDGSINFDSLSKLIEFQIENYTDAIIVCGTTGESATMTTKEHLSTIEYVVNKVNGRIPVIAGAGSNNTKHAVELSLAAQKIGVDGLLIVTPYYNTSQQRGIIRHYNIIADTVSTPIILYNVPSRTGCNIKPETYFELSKHPNIVATKEASGDISSIIKTRHLCKDDLQIYSGNDDQVVPVMSVGGIGVVSVFANICPMISHEMAKKCLEGEFKKAAKLQIDYIDIINELFSDINPIPVKEALNILGFNCGKCRLPLDVMTPGQQDRLEAVLAKHNLLIK